MLINGRKEQRRREKLLKTVENEENTNNVNAGNPNDSTFAVSMSRETHAISCANKTRRNFISQQLFSGSLQAKTKPLFSSDFSPSKTMFFGLFKRAIFCTRTGSLFQSSREFQRAELFLWLFQFSPFWI